MTVILIRGESKVKVHAVSLSTGADAKRLFKGKEKAAT